MIALVGCTPSEPSDAFQRAAPPNVLLIVIDTLRADSLGCYGYERDTSPRIDRLAADSLRYAQAISPAPWTMPAMASIHTGLYPRSHGFARIGRRLPEAVTTLAEIYRDAGYRTAMVNSNSLVRAALGLSQGFEVYHDEDARGHDYISTSGLTEKASALLEEYAAGAAPFFLSVLYFDPHYSYRAHPEVDFARLPTGRIDGDESIQELRELGPQLDRSETQTIRALYDEEIRHTDSGVGRLLDRLSALQLDRNTLVVVTSDHGEEFWEHAWLGHTRNLYDNLLHVPLILHDPRREAGGQVVAEPVSTVSIAATLIALSGLDSAAHDFQAPVLPLSATQPGDAHPLFSEVDFLPVDVAADEKIAKQRAIRWQDKKLVRDDLLQRDRLYALGQDPGELVDVAQQFPELVIEYGSLLEAHTSMLEAQAFGIEQHQVTDHQVELLRGLGYVDAPKLDAPDSDAPEPDGSKPDGSKPE